MASPAYAADKALILSDQDQMALKQILDAAVRQSGLSVIAKNAIIFSERLDAAGVVTDQKVVPDKPQVKEPPKESPKESPSAPKPPDEGKNDQ